MPLKTSLFNKGVFMDDLKRFSWLGILYTLALFFVVPLHILMTYGQEDPDYTVIKELFYLNGGDMQGVLVLVVSLFMGIFIFRYMQVKNSSDMMHSLPIKRKVLYRTHILTSLILLILPVLLTAFISLILNQTLDLGAYFNILDIAIWAGFIILTELAIFFVCVFVGMLVGMSVVQGIIATIFLFLPLGLTVLLTDSLNIFLYGFAYNWQINEEKLSPIVRLLDGFNDTNKMGNGEIATYIIVCLGLYFLAQFLYDKRKLETASQTIAFQHFRWVFKFGVTLCTMLVAGSYFYHTQHNINWIIFGYVFGSLIGYYVAEMVLKKTFFVFKNIKDYGIYAGVIIVIFLGLHFDLMGYERRLPEVNEIKSISFGNGFYEFENGQKLYVDRANIKNIYLLHQQLIKDKLQNKYGNKKSTRERVLVYHLRDGSQITRGYSINDDCYTQYLKPIYESKEYKKFYYDALRVAASDVEKMTIQPSLDRQDTKEAVILNPEEIKEALHILKQDIEAETYEQMTDHRTAWASIRLLISDDKMKKYRKGEMDKDRREIYTSWEKSYGNFEAWLKDKGYLKNARILPEEIDYIVVEKLESTQQWEAKRRNGEWLDTKGTKRLEIKDKDQIEICLRNYSEVWDGENQDYIIGFYTEGHVNIGFGSFKAANAPDFIKDQLL
ncbi:hypothetical protein Dred_3241 [Desulforamulus reducens MI-1]|uniref:DUF6449 domain-containing protein n=1 Tax=Desulforamulus reducens (strain ATCC BAA-1160 / DSM 100696 / MI-1) TaxID=349161 RepID=A4J9J0_DESRM|nr:DUF6449 domain-containing protein [Desulforamulus reducens]ABO51743.1 hypothetical protein Dred_3241 [Desulforamulus reducens MI-1]